jgi:hypothetical protein
MSGHQAAAIALDARAPGSGPDVDADDLRRASDRIERLLGELRASTAPATWARIQELVSSMTTIYGRGLARTLEIFAETDGVDDRTRTALCEDSLVGSLLLLHGLHPSPIEERVARAVEEVRRAVGASGGQIEVAPISAAGSVTVRISGDWRRSPVPPDAIEAAVRRAIEEAAPDLVRLDIGREGAHSAPTGLVQIDLTRSRRDASEVVR